MSTYSIFAAALSITPEADFGQAVIAGNFTPADWASLYCDDAVSLHFQEVYKEKTGKYPNLRPMEALAGEKEDAAETYFAAVKALLQQNGLSDQKEICPLCFTLGPAPVLEFFKDSPLLPQIQKVAEALI